METTSKRKSGTTDLTVGKPLYRRWTCLQQSLRW